MHCHLPYLYDFCGYVLQVVSNAKYLGVTITDKVEWYDQINRVTKKANTSSTLFPGTWSTVLTQHMRSHTVSSPTAVLSIIRLYGTPDCRRTRTLWRRSTNMQYTFFSSEFGETVQWAPNLWRIWRGCPLKPGVTINACASCIRSLMVLSPCHPLNLLNPIVPLEDISTNIRHYVLVINSIRAHSIPGAYPNITNSVEIL